MEPYTWGVLNRALGADLPTRVSYDLHLRFADPPGVVDPPARLVELQRRTTNLKEKNDNNYYYYYYCYYYYY